MDYTLDALPRLILDKALTSSVLRPGRIYATQFLLVLLRAKILNFEVWGIPMLIKQTKDKERGVVLTAFEILEEACHHRVSFYFYFLFINVLNEFWGSSGNFGFVQIRVASD